LASEVAQKYSSGTPRGVLDEERRHPWSDRMAALFRPGLSVIAEASSDGSKSDRHTKRRIIRKLRPDMIRRMDDAPMPVNPSGLVTEEKAPSLRSACSRTSRAGDQTVDVVGSEYHPHGSPEVKADKKSSKSSPEPSTSSSSDEYVVLILGPQFSSSCL
jgi:hypothetical protein